MRRTVALFGPLVATAMVAPVVIVSVLRVADAGWSDFLWNWGFAQASIVVNVALVGGVLAARRPRNPIGWILLLLAWQSASGLLAVPAVIGVPWSGVLVAIMLLVPHGRLHSRAWRPIMDIVVVGVCLVVLGDWTGVEPGGVALWDRVEPVFILLLPVAALSMVLRYRASRGIERLQVRAVAAACVFAVVAVFVTVPFGLLPIVNGIAIPAIAWGLAVGVLRYRLYDLDRVISRTVSYGLLTMALGGAYALVVFSMALLQPGARSDLAVAVATLTAAALFSPLRRRFQRAVDRRFNRASYDAAATISSFAADLRDQLDADALIAAVRAVATQSMQPSSATVWIAPRGPSG